MLIVWDEPKRIANLVKHGIDFADIDGTFFLDAFVGEAKDGRFFAVGRLDGVVTVIFALLGSEAISLISARPASKKERKLVA